MYQSRGLLWMAHWLPSADEKWKRLSAKRPARLNYAAGEAILKQSETPGCRWRTTEKRTRNAEAIRKVHRDIARVALEKRGKLRFWGKTIFNDSHLSAANGNGNLLPGNHADLWWFQNGFTNWFAFFSNVRAIKIQILSSSTANSFLLILEIGFMNYGEFSCASLLWCYSDILHKTYSILEVVCKWLINKYLELMFISAMKTLRKYKMYDFRSQNNQWTRMAVSHHYCECPIYFCVSNRCYFRISW